MTMTLGDLIRQAVETVKDPRAGAAWVKSLDMTRPERWQALLLIVVLSVLLGQATSLLLLGGPNDILGPLLANPFTATITQMSILVVMVFAIYFIGHALGGTGGMGATISLVTWLQFVMVCLQVVQTLAMILLPPLAGLIGVVGLVLFFWLLTNFTAELHGFTSLGRVFSMIVLALLGFAFGLSVILAMIGITIPGAV